VFENAQVRASRFELLDPLGELRKFSVSESQNVFALRVGTKEEQYFVITKQRLRIAEPQAREARKNRRDAAMFARTEATLQCVELIENVLYG
jgi:hypothetical protein